MTERSDTVPILKSGRKPKVDDLLGVVENHDELCAARPKVLAAVNSYARTEEGIGILTDFEAA